MTKNLNIAVGSDNVFRDLGSPEAAQRAAISQPRMSDLVKGRTHKFILDALVNVVAHLGYTMKLSLQKVA